MHTTLDTPAHPELQRSFRAIRALLVALLVFSLAAVGFAIAEQGDPSLVNTVVWIRSIAVVIGAAILYAFAFFAAQGRDWAYRRLRLLSFLIPAGVVLLIAAPGEFPLWIKVQQGVCGALILAVGVILSTPRMRRAFPKHAR